MCKCVPCVRRLQTEHGGDGLYSCDECRKTFIYQKWFDAHKVRQTCGLKATCSLCGAEVVKGAGLSAHMRRVHAGEKRVPCSYCSYRAFTKTQVRLHERTHTRTSLFGTRLRNSCLIQYNDLIDASVDFTLSFDKDSAIG